MKHLALLCIALCLAGCSTTKTDVRNESRAAQYDPTTSARVRIISGEQTFGRFIAGQTCEVLFNETLKSLPKGSNPWIAARPDDPAWFPMSRKTDYQNNTIGMPQSNASRTINESKHFYDEHVVPANQPVIVVMSLWSTQLSCYPPAVAITPKPGEDYEIALEYSQGACYTAIRKLAQLGTATIEVPVSPAICRKDNEGKTHTIDPLQPLEKSANYQN